MSILKTKIVAVDSVDYEGKYCQDQGQDRFSKDLMYDDTPGLSEVVDLGLWNLLDERSKNMLRDSALSNQRPQGIEKDFWDTLDERVRTDIIFCLSKDKQIRCNVKAERPEEVDPQIWQDIDMETQKKIVNQLYAIRPPGFDPELWENMNERNRQRIAYDQKIANDAKKEVGCLPAWFIKEVVPTGKRSKRSYLLWWLQRITYKSRVVSFFIYGNHYVMEEPDAGMSAMALVCALILTIPFGIFSILNDGFFTAIREAIEVN
jgi:hypothetical protein